MSKDKSRNNEEQDASLAEPLSIDESGAEEVSEKAVDQESEDGELIESSEEIAGEEIRGEEIEPEEIPKEEISTEELLTEEPAIEDLIGEETVEEPGESEAVVEQSEDSPDNITAGTDSEHNGESAREESEPAVDVAALGDAVRAAGEISEEEQPLLPQLVPNPSERRALLEAIVYVAEDPLTADQIAAGLQMPVGVIQADLDKIIEESRQTERGIEIRKVAGGYKMFTKAEHHDAIRNFVKTLRPKLRLSLPALETLAVIAYKQPVTVPEIQAIRGVNAGGVIHTLLSHKLVTTAGRKKVIGRPMQYKTTKEFLVQFGLNDLSELPNLKELEELSRQALGEGEEVIQAGRTGAGDLPPAEDSSTAVEESVDEAVEGTVEEAAEEAESADEPRDTADDGAGENADTQFSEEASNEGEPEDAATDAVATGDASAEPEAKIEDEPEAAEEESPEEPSEEKN